MLKIKKISEVVGKQVYTSDGDYFGLIEEVNLVDNKIEGWRIRVSGGFGSVLGGARGVIIPHQFVKAIGDVFIINKGSYYVYNRRHILDVTLVLQCFENITLILLSFEYSLLCFQVYKVRKGWRT
jgi:sporulation protein YlmC with PRC-barrel domain